MSPSSSFVQTNSMSDDWGTKPSITKIVLLRFESVPLASRFAEWNSKKRSQSKDGIYGFSSSNHTGRTFADEKERKAMNSVANGRILKIISDFSWNDIQKDIISSLASDNVAFISQAKASSSKHKPSQSSGSYSSYTTSSSKAKPTATPGLADEIKKLPQYWAILLRESKFKVSKEGSKARAGRGQDFKPVRTEKEALMTIDEGVTKILLSMIMATMGPQPKSPKCLMQFPFFSNMSSHDSDGELGTVTIKTGRVNVNTGKQNVSSGSLHVSSGTHIKSGTSSFNTEQADTFNSGVSMYVTSVPKIRQVVSRVNAGKQNVNSGSIYVNSGTKNKSGSSRVNAGKQNANSGRVHVNTARITRPVLSNPTSQDHPLKHMENRGIFDSGCSGHIQICDKKLNVLFTEKECFVVSSDFKMPDENRRLGHLNFKNLNKLVKDNLVRGLPSKSFKNDHTCVACQKGKQHKASCKAKIERFVTHPLHTLHMDLFGPTSVRSINHASYCLVITDDCSRFCWVFFLAKKDETSDILKTFIRQIENQLNQKVKIIRSDNGTEFKNRVMLEFCREKGIKQEFSNARTPQQNGVAERMNRTLIEAARTMLADSHLPTTFWAEAVNTACYTFNRVRVTKPQNKTPYELLFGHKPILSYIRPFGCHVTILNTLSPLGKFDGKSDEGFLVGYSVNSKAFRVYNLVTKRVEVNLHVNFLEEKPNVQGIGHRWMFDLDYLTDSMNYIPVSLQNQANPAGSKEVIDIDVQTEEAADLMKKPLDALALNTNGQTYNTPTSTNPVNTGSSDFNTGDEQVSPGHIEAVAPSAHNVEENALDDANAGWKAMQEEMLQSSFNKYGFWLIYHGAKVIGLPDLNRKQGRPSSYLRQGILPSDFSSQCCQEDLNIPQGQNQFGIMDFPSELTPLIWKHSLIVTMVVPTLTGNPKRTGFTADSGFPQKKIKNGYALTHNPPIYDSLIKQFWQTATARTLADGTQQLNATIDTIEHTILYEESVRRQLQLADASGIHMLQNEEIFEGLQNIGQIDLDCYFWLEKIGSALRKKLQAEALQLNYDYIQARLMPEDQILAEK
ncbi:putative ribonuclease H-like domain-containing protein [Tanacetum coccineum]